MRLEFHPEARDEFVAAAAYYDAAVPGLGDRFLVAVRRTTDLVLRHPTAGTPRKAARGGSSSRDSHTMSSIRSAGEVVEVLAVAHQHRRPGYWRERLSG